MATYIDVSALVGIKIHSSGVLETNETVTVPANCYAQFFVQDLTNDDLRYQNIMIAGGGTTFGLTAGNNFTLNGTSSPAANTGSTNYVHYVIFQNNQ